MTETLRMTPMTSTTSLEPDAPVVRPTLLRRLALDTAYALSALPLAIIAFAVSVIGFALGVGLAVVWIGVAVLAGTLILARGVAHLERQRLRSLQLRAAPAPVYVAAPAGASRVRRLLTPLRDPQSWLDLLWGVVGFVTGLVAFVVTVTWWAVVLGGLTYWFWQRWVPQDDTTLVELIGLGEGQTAESVLYLVVGAVALLVLPVVVRAVAAVHAGLGQALLCSRAELQAEVRRVEGSRDAARRAEADSLRRLERDIHDGPQQRLMRLTLDVSRARKQLTDDPARAGETLDTVLEQARASVDELRALSRGIAPPLLVDRGLTVALQELVNRGPVPVSAHLDVPADLPPHVETAIYFVVSESLTNVAKHSGAQAVTVDVTERNGKVEVRVEDDGSGGAHLGKGQGLAGLQQRLAGVDGTFEVTSPVGGPTVVRAEIPV
ncbi:sensor histidine kinase [Nocardioides sp.]|uniref:sensor histidine kinase n=1 Tax=Nocardioides sp. TaxID=35761 RepID=UPI002ED4A53A